MDYLLYDLPFGVNLVAVKTPINTAQMSEILYHEI
jgi:hypothetical protein